jgi:hypothetical protein
LLHGLGSHSEKKPTNRVCACLFMALPTYNITETHAVCSFILDAVFDIAWLKLDKGVVTTLIFEVCNDLNSFNGAIVGDKPSLPEWARDLNTWGSSIVPRRLGQPWNRAE